MRRASCASAPRSCATARSNGTPLRWCSPRPGARVVDALDCTGERHVCAGEPAKVALRRSNAGRGHVRRAHQPRRAVGKRALRVGAGAARQSASRRRRTARRKAITWHPWVELDRRPRAGARFRAPHATAARAFAGASRNAKTVSWRVARSGDGGVAVALPARSGRYDALGARHRGRRQRQRRLLDGRRCASELPGRTTMYKLRLPRTRSSRDILSR